MKGTHGTQAGKWGEEEEPVRWGKEPHPAVLVSLFGRHHGLIGLSFLAAHA